MGLPVGKHIVPDKPLPVNDELTWDNGTSFPELLAMFPVTFALARAVARMLTLYETLAWLFGGLSFFASLGLLAVWNDNASTIPFAPKVYPYYNLRVELGGEPCNHVSKIGYLKTIGFACFPHGLQLHR